MTRNFDLLFVGPLALRAMTNFDSGLRALVSGEKMIVTILRMKAPLSVIPAKAGIQPFLDFSGSWPPPG